MSIRGRHLSRRGLFHPSVDSGPSPQLSQAVIAVTDVGTQDLGVDYAAFQRTKPYLPVTSLNRFGVRNAAIQARPVTGGSLKVRALIDYGKRTVTRVIQLSAAADEASAEQVIRALDSFSLTEMTALQIEILDEDTPTGQWAVDAIVLVTTVEQTS